MAIAQTVNARPRVPKRFVALVVKLIVSGALAWYLVTRTDLSESADRLATLHPAWALAALVVFGLFLFLGAVRWLIFTRALRIPLSLGAAVRIFVIGQFFGQVLPAGVGGDAVRVWLLTRRDAGLGPSVSSVLLDRLTGLATLLVLIALTLPGLFNYVDDGRARLGVVLLLLVGTLGFAMLFALSYVPRLAKQWPRMRALAEAVAIARRTALSPKPALCALGLSFVMHLLVLLSVCLLARGLSLDLDPLVVLSLIPPVILISTLPISLAGWGVREGAMVGALGFVGVAAGDALALSVLFGLAILAISLAGSVLWLTQGRETPRNAQGKLDPDGSVGISAP